VHCILQALFFAVASAGSNSAASMAMMAMTTNSSIRVNAREAVAGLGGWKVVIWSLSCVLRSGGSASALLKPQPASESHISFPWVAQELAHQIWQ
jgi:hypothetical protein